MGMATPARRDTETERSGHRTWLLFGILFLLCLLVVVLLLVEYCQQVGMDHYLYGVDFRSFYAAGRILLDGESARLYDVSTQYAWQSRLVEMDDLSQVLVFFNPPFVALPFALIALCPFPLAYLVWAVIDALLLGVIGYLALELLEDAPCWASYLAVVATVFFLPAIVTLLQGQLSFLLVLGVLLSMRAIRAGADFEGGLWLALLLIKPQLAVIPLLALVWQRRWRAVSGMAVAGAGCALLSAIAVGWNGLSGWFDLMLRAVGWGDQFGIHPERMYTWRGVLYRILGGEQAGAITGGWLAGAGLVLLLLLWVWRRRASGDSVAFDVQWALLVFVMLFASPHAYLHDLSLLLIPLVLLARLGAHRWKRRRYVRHWHEESPSISGGASERLDQ